MELDAVLGLFASLVLASLGSCSSGRATSPAREKLEVLARRHVRASSTRRRTSLLLLQPCHESFAPLARVAAKAAAKDHHEDEVALTKELRELWNSLDEMEDRKDYHAIVLTATKIIDIAKNPQSQVAPIGLATFYGQRGTALVHLQDLEKAVQDFDLALKFGPKNQSKAFDCASVTSTVAPR